MNQVLSLFRAGLSRNSPGGSNSGALYEPPDLPTVIQNIYPFVTAFIYGVAPVVVVAMLVYAGVTRMLAVDNSRKVSEANATIFWAIAGYATLLLSFLLVRLALTVVGFDIEGVTIDL
ncbi:MAG: hypothetical protein QY312_02255 [Candidatus Dojkabacteria bacterium]|nr:MAG: hypothetical protein QY312_02255 [Candidatus Dojkabacteria bacterium]